MTTTSMAQQVRATTIRKTFNRETSVSVNIQADPTILWALLTNASDYTRWNSTITSIEGTIAPGEKIKLKSILDAKRTFTLKVKEFQEDKKLVWGDAQGNRTYRIQDNHNGSVTFTMTEKIGGPLFPLFAKMIPPFDSAFEQFANDLKKEAELISKTK